MSFEIINIYLIGNKSNISSGISASQSSRSRSSKSWSDEATNENEMNDEPTNRFNFDSLNKSSSILQSNCQIQDKYRCDQMILEHNNGPIDYEQIQLPVPTTKKYLTGFFFILFYLIKNETFFFLIR